MDKKKSVSIWTANFISIFIVNFVLYMGQYMMNALIPKYANYLGATATIVGTVSGMFAVTSLAIRPVAGPAFDYFSRKKLLMAAIGIITLAFVGYSISANVYMLMASRLLHGFGVGCMGPLCLTIAGDALPEDRMASGLGIFPWHRPFPPLSVLPPDCVFTKLSGIIKPLRSVQSQLLSLLC